MEFNPESPRILVVGSSNVDHIVFDFFSLNVIGFSCQTETVKKICLSETGF